MIRANTARFILLGLLSHKPMSGYDIKKNFSRGMSHFWNLSYGQIYPTLKTLEREGLVTLKMETSRGGCRRKTYSITREGLNELQKWMLEPVQKEIPLKLFFGNQIPVEKNIERIRTLQQENVRDLEKLKHFENELKPTLNQSKDHLYMLLMLLLGREVCKARIKWANEAINMLEKC